MNELFKVVYDDNRITLSARELHGFLEVTERFSNWFDRMNQYGFIENHDYLGCKVFNTQAHQELQDYQITLEMAKEIAMIQRSEKGKEARQYFIQLEKKWNSPECVMNRALEYSKQQVEKLMLENLEMKPKALFADAVSASKTSILVGDLAKLLKQNGYDTGATRLFKRLRDEGYLCKRKGSEWNMPTQKSMDLGLFEIKVSTHIDGNGVNITTRTPKITGKGQIYFVNKFCVKGEAR